MDARRFPVVAAICLAILAVTGLRLATLASAAGPATRDAQMATFGTTAVADLPPSSARP